ncbi:MAG: hypothetical protein Alis3KO_17710 [Aliiglaciecola sp.]
MGIPINPAIGIQRKNKIDLPLRETRIKGFTQKSGRLIDMAEY